MSKVVKIIAGAVLVAIGVIVPGAQFLVQIGVGLALAGIAEAFAGTPAMAQDQAGQKAPVTNRIDSQKLLYGSNRVGGAEIFVEEYGKDNEDIVIARVVADHVVDGFGAFHLGDKAISFDASGNATTAPYAGKLWLKTYDGSQAIADPWIMAAHADADASMVGLGKAYYVIKAKFDPEVFPYGIGELRQTSIIVNGKRVYDPRRDDTVAGGLGPQRIADASSWTYSLNPALCTYDYLREMEIGAAVPVGEIDVDAIISAANICDAEVILKAGGTHKRYEVNGVIDSGRKIQENLKTMLTGMVGWHVWDGGKIGIYAADYAAPTVFLSEDDIAEINASPAPSINESFNEVGGLFVDPAQDFEAVDYPVRKNATYLSEDGAEVRRQDITFPLCHDNRRAQRMAKIFLERSRRPTISFRAKPGALEVRPGRVFALSWDNFDWAGKLFRARTVTVANLEPLEVQIEAQAEDAAIYTWDPVVDELVLSDPANLTHHGPHQTITPTGLSVAPVIDVAADGASQPILDVSYSDPGPLVSRSLIDLRRSGTVNWEQGTIANSNEVRAVLPVSAGNWDVRLRHVGRNGVIGPDAQVSAISVANSNTAGDVAAIGGIDASIVVSNAQTGFDLTQNNGVTLDQSSFGTLDMADLDATRATHLDGVAVGANLTTNTNQLTDGAGLGNTALWSGVTGTGLPADNADVTIDQLSGSGANLWHPAFSSDMQALPASAPSAGTNGTAELWQFDVAGRKAPLFRLLAAAADQWQYLGTSTSDYNVKLSPNQKWIISAWVRCPVASKTGQLFVRTSTAGQHYNVSFITSLSAGVWTRVSGIIDLSADNSPTCILRVDNDSVDQIMYFDDMMLEPMIGNNTVPSPYVKPQTRLGIDVDEGATLGATWGADIFGRPVELTDGRLSAGLNASGDLLRNITQARADGSNLFRRTGGGLFTGETNADRTASHTSADTSNVGGTAAVTVRDRANTGFNLTQNNATALHASSLPTAVLDGASVLRRSGGGLFTGATNATVGATWGSNLTGRPTELTDGRVAAGLSNSGDIVRNLPTGIGVDQGGGVARVLPRGPWSSTALDGVAVTFPNPYAGVPNVFFQDGGLIRDSSLTGDTAQRKQALNLTASGFTPDIKLYEKSGAPVSQVDSSGQTTTGTRDIEMNKSAAEAWDNRYSFQYDVQIINTPLGGGEYEPGWIDVGIYTNNGGGWVQRATVRIHGGGIVPTTTKSNRTTTVIVSGLTNHAGREFGVSVVASMAGGAVTALDSVSYETASAPQEVSATPAGVGGIPFLALEGQEA